MQTVRNIPTDEQLWATMQQGDQTAFAELMQRYYARLLHFGVKFTPDTDLIRDCLQDLFVHIWERRAHLYPTFAVKAYLFSAFRNNLLRAIQQQNRTELADFTESPPENDLEPSIEDTTIDFENLTEQIGQLQALFAQLPARQKEALYLRYYENLSYDQIAAVMGLKNQAVANYIQYGLQKLRHNWQHFVWVWVLQESRFY